MELLCKKINVGVKHLGDKLLVIPDVTCPNASPFSDSVKIPNNWEVYESILRIPYYVVLSRYTNELKGFHLVGGHYEAINLTN